MQIAVFHLLYIHVCMCINVLIYITILYIHMYLESRTHRDWEATVWKHVFLWLYFCFIKYFKPVKHYCPFQMWWPVAGAELRVSPGWCSCGCPNAQGHLQQSEVLSAPCQDPDSFRTFPLKLLFRREIFSFGGCPGEDVHRVCGQQSRWVKVRELCPSPARSAVCCPSQGCFTSFSNSPGGKLCSHHLNVWMKIVVFVQSASHLVCFPQGWRESFCIWRHHLRIPWESRPSESSQRQRHLRPAAPS